MASPEETTTIVVSADVATLIDRAVATGSYGSASDAIRDALMEREARGDDLLSA